MVTLLAKSDYPGKQAPIQAKQSSTFAELRILAAKALSIEEKDIGAYSFMSVTFGQDVLPLTGNKDDQTLSALGIKENSTLFLSAPVGVRPQRQKKKKPPKEEQKEEDEGRHKYKGFTPKNALKRALGSRTSKKKLAFEYIDIYISEVMHTPQWLSLPLSLVTTIAKSARLNCEEIKLFEGVLAWGKAEGERQKVDVSVPGVLKKILQPVLPYVRFCLLDTQDVALQVTPTHLLTSTQVLELFTYLGMKNAGQKSPKLGKSLVGFQTKPRQSRKPPAWFKWDHTKKHNNLTLSTDGRSVSSTTTAYYQPLFGDQVLENGVWEWEMKIVQMYSNTYAFNVGVVPASCTGWTNSQMIGYSGHLPGWAFACGHGQKYNSQMNPYGTKCKSGDAVRIKLDLDKKTLEFFINGKSQGIAFENVQAPVRPALSLYGNNTIRLEFP